MTALNRRVRGALVIATTMAAAGYYASWRPSRVAAQGSLINIRPTTNTTTTFANPGNAYDTSDSTSAGSTITRVCNQHCTTGNSATVTFLGIPNGYHPIRLEVHWLANANFALFGADTGQVIATIEVSLDQGSSWSVLETYTWTANSGSCPGNHSITCTDHVKTLNLSDYQTTGAVEVRATLSAQMTHCDNCTLRVSNAAGSLSVYDVRIVADDCEIPIDETTSATGWDTDGYQQYSQTLTKAPGGSSFNGRTVTEQDPGGGGPDTCYWVGSAYLPWTAVTGNSWSVNASEVWQYDALGWGHTYVTYYRAQGRAPCSTQFQQRMVISCGAGVVVPYVLNDLSAGMDATHEWAERASVNASHTWP